MIAGARVFTDTLRRQHEEILKVLSAVEPLLGRQRVDGLAATQLRGQLVELAGKVTIHLAAEDRVLYPKLQQGTEPKLAEAANRFAKEMGELASAFKTFVAKYPTPESIEKHYEAFAKDTAAVAGLLVHRIRREEAELYPLADHQLH